MPVTGIAQPSIIQPTNPDTPSIAIWQWGVIFIGDPATVPSGRRDAAVEIEVGPSDTAATVVNKIRDAMLVAAGNNGIAASAISARDLVIPSLTKG